MIDRFRSFCLSFDLPVLLVAQSICFVDLAFVVFADSLNMPTFVLHTNVPSSKVTPAMLKELSALLAKLLSKPEMVLQPHRGPRFVVYSVYGSLLGC